MDIIEATLRHAGVITAEDDSALEFTHANSFEIHNVPIEVPDDAELTKWTCTINGVKSAMICKETFGGTIDLQSKGQVFCTAHENDEIRVQVHANQHLFLEGKFTCSRETPRLAQTRGYMFLVNNDTVFLHVLNIEGKGNCICAMNVKTRAFV
jgi:hypothetical protein